jgi:Kef-type K+ transport system membrane component KefB
MHLLFWIGFLFLVGYVSGVLSERFRLPKVTGYLLVGLLLSPSVSGLLPPVFMEKSEAIVHFALAVVAFMIGGSLKLEKVRKLEKSIVAIMLAEAELAFFFVAAGMMALLPFVYAVSPYTQGAEHSLMVPLFLGAISAATAPAAVLAVIHQYRARGPLTLTLLGVVATDDAAALINFSVVLGVGSLLMGLSEGPLYLALLDPLGNIGISVACGVAVGWVQGRHLNVITSESGQVISSVGLLLLLYGVMDYFAWDGLLAAMSYGMMLVNTSTRSDELFSVIRYHYEEMIFVLFFLISGATMELDVMTEVWPVALLYVGLRILGKVIGSRIGARLSGAPDEVRRYIGPALMPQAGVAIGLALILYHHREFGGIGVIVLNTIIAATVINELVGPLLLKAMLVKANEVEETP